MTHQFLITWRDAGWFIFGALSVAFAWWLNVETHKQAKKEREK